VARKLDFLQAQQVLDAANEQMDSSEMGLWEVNSEVLGELFERIGQE